MHRVRKNNLKKQWLKFTNVVENVKLQKKNSRKGKTITSHNIQKTENINKSNHWKHQKEIIYYI